MKIVSTFFMCLLVTTSAIQAQQVTPAPGPSATPPSPAFDTPVTPAPAAPAAPAGSRTVVVLPEGTQVTVSFVNPVSSDKNTLGEQVPVQVAKEVDVNGMIVVAKGAQGQATLTTVEHSGGNGSGGKVIFNVDWVYSADGGKIALSSVNHATDNADSKGAASTLGILGWATFGVLGLFSHNLAHGKEAIIPSTKVFTVYVDHAVHVTASQQGTAAPGFDS